MSRQTTYWPFGGGLNLVSPAIQMPPGQLIAGNNFEPWINGGYRRIRGYERLDGRPEPHKAEWLKLCLDDIGEYAVDDEITGDTSGATGTIAAIDGNCIAVTQVSGTFQEDEDIDTATATIASVQDRGASGVEQFEAFRYGAQEVYRGDIQQVPGINDIRGCWQVEERIYAIRDNVGETAGVIHKATSSGWDDSQLTMATTVYYGTGSEIINEGDTITGATSSATATVHRVVIHSGAPGTSDAAGYLALTGVSGTFTADETINIGGSPVADIIDTPEVYALPVGGRYVFKTYNFLAGSGTVRVYACGGVGPAIEIDEDDVVTPILLDLSLGDAPEENNPFYLEVFDGRLWLAFPGGSLQQSVVGAPLTFNGFLGAAEFGLGDEITGLVASPGQVLVAYTRRSTHGFYIADAGYVKRVISLRSGAILYSQGQLSTQYTIDDSGMTDLRRVDQFGDFADSTISGMVQPYLEKARERIAGVMMIRETNQYRVMFTDGTALVAKIKPRGMPEFGTLKLPTSVSCAYWCENTVGEPRYLFGGSSGYVYRAEVGQNFDGASMESFARLPYSHQGDPASRKRYHLAELELEALRRLTLRVGQELSYSNSETGSRSWEPSVLGGGGFYDQDNWDEIYWDAQQFNNARIELLGTGNNISLAFVHSSATADPFVMQGIVLHFSPRRKSR